MIVVMKYEGKGGDSKADRVSVHLFGDDREQADKFCRDVERTGKHWVKAGIVNHGVNYETYPEYL